MASIGVWFCFIGIHRLPETPGTGNVGFSLVKIIIANRVLTFLRPSWL